MATKQTINVTSEQVAYDREGTPLIHGYQCDRSDCLFHVEGLSIEQSCFEAARHEGYHNMWDATTDGDAEVWGIAIGMLEESMIKRGWLDPEAQSRR